jgi:hypothetical protein
MTEPAPPPLATVAEFADADAMVAALRDARAAGWTRLDAYAPRPVPEAAELLDAHGSPVGWIAISAGIFAGALQFGVQTWLNAVEYPLNVGGRPLFAWPAFLPAALIVGVLWSAVAALVGMLVLNRLPRLHHPIFETPGFGRASEDRYFLALFAEPRDRDAAAAARRLLRRHRPLRISDLPR